nr:retinol dehydrogenase 11-like [Leptinotarsa decemlineata]
MSLLAYLSSFVLIALAIKVYLKVTTRWCQNKVCLVGKTVVVTGANSGLGYEVSLEFAKRGARVILACRNEDKAKQARDQIISETQNPNVVVKLVNMASLASIRNFASDILKSEKRLDILINNAGTGILRNEFTEDGLQVLMQVNYFGSVLLTMLLMDLLEKSSPSRIINISSILAKQANLTKGNLNTYTGMSVCYPNSKLGLILFTMKLAKLLKTSSVSVYSLHPGVIDTNIFNNVPIVGSIITQYFAKYFFKTVEEGIQTILHTALTPGLEIYSGKHFEECDVVETYKTARDLELMETIWKETMRLIKCEEISEKLQLDAKR